MDDCNMAVELTGNDLVLPLPPAVKDPVGADINDIPRALKAITESMDGENAMPLYCLGKELMLSLIHISEPTRPY